MSTGANVPRFISRLLLYSTVCAGNLPSGAAAITLALRELTIRRLRVRLAALDWPLVDHDAEHLVGLLDMVASVPAAAAIGGQHAARRCVKRKLSGGCAGQ